MASADNVGYSKRGMVDVLALLIATSAALAESEFLPCLLDIILDDTEKSRCAISYCLLR